MWEPPTARTAAFAIIGAPMELSALSPGQVLVDQELTLSAETSAAYREAVEDTSAVYQEHTAVPPTALAALALAAVMRAVELPAGAVHVGQELEFTGAVEPGASLRCTVSVAGNGVRGGNRLLALRFQVTRESQPVVAGRTSIIVPGEASA